MVGSSFVCLIRRLRVAAVVALPGAACSTAGGSSGGGSAEGDAEVLQRHVSARVESLTQLDERLSDCAAPSCPHLVYVWAASMPLSVTGMDEIAAAAESLGAPLSMVSAAAVREGNDALRRTLVEAGATVHFPSVTLFRGATPFASAVAGYKRAEAYEAVLRPRLDELTNGAVAHAPASIGPPASRAAAAAGATQDQTPDVSVVWRQELPRRTGNFFRRVPGTRYVTFDMSRTVYLHHLETGERFAGPGYIDFVPTPDGALFVTPGPGDSGLEFYVAREVIERGREGEGRDVQPVIVDTQMADQYPSVGILETNSTRTVYRILVSWFEGLAVRDYEVVRPGRDSVYIRTLTPKIRACNDLPLSTPMLSKSGHEIAARDERSGTTKIFRYLDDGSCEEEVDLGRQTSKVAWSDDGRLVAYSSPDADGTGRSTTYVFDRETETIRAVPGSETRRLVIPDMVGPDSVLTQAFPRGRRGVEFRLFCCVSR